MLLPMQSGSGSQATPLSLLGSYTERRPSDSTLWKRLQEAEQRHATSEKAAAAVVQRPSKAVAAAGLESALEEQSRLAAARHAGANVLTKRQQRQLEMNRRYTPARAHTLPLCFALSVSPSLSLCLTLCLSADLVSSTTAAHLLWLLAWRQTAPRPYHCLRRR